MPRRHPVTAPALIIAVVALCARTSSAATETDGPDDAADGGNLIALYKNALTLHQQGEKDAALGIYERLLRDDGMRSKLAPAAAATLYNNAGGIHYQNGNAEAAHEHFAAAVALAPGHAEALVNLALVLSEDLGRHEEAMVHARRAVGLRPEHPKSHHLLGNILQRAGQDPEAHLRFKTAEALAAGQLARAPRGLFQWRAARVGQRQGQFTFRPFLFSPPFHSPYIIGGWFHEARLDPSPFGEHEHGFYSITLNVVY